MSNTEDEAKMRHPAHNIHSLILNRWSPRSMTGEGITYEDLMGLFEAARWAPSSYNNQPWRFIYATRDTKHWEVLFNLLIEGNKAWAKVTSVLIVAIARKNFEFNEKPARTNQFDAGAAWETLALEATFRGLATHGMQGFDYEKARKDLEIPENFDILAMIAVGRRAPREHLQPQLQEREYPSDRKPLKDIVMEAKFVK
jgi:nitroreductase